MHFQPKMRKKQPNYMDEILGSNPTSKFLTGKIFFSLSEIVLFSVFPNTMAYENTQQNSICHQFLFIPHLRYT